MRYKARGSTPSMMTSLFENDPLANTTKMLAQDPLKEIDLGGGAVKKANIHQRQYYPSNQDRSNPIIERVHGLFRLGLRKKPSLSRDIGKLKLPIKRGKKPLKQTPRRFVSELPLKIKEEVERRIR